MLCSFCSTLGCPIIAKYTCPRCNAPYCSSACFAIHSTGCTEKFFKREVEGELRLRAKEDNGKASRVKTILALARDSGGGGLKSSTVLGSDEAGELDGYNKNADDYNDDDDDDDEEEDADLVAEAKKKRRGELQLAAECISQSEERGTSFSINTVEAILGGPDLVSAVRRSALQQNLKYTWVPWWKQTPIQHSLAVAHASSCDDRLPHGNETSFNATSLAKDIDPSLQTPPCQLLSEHTSIRSIQTLDELLRSRKQPSPLLKFNLLDLLVAYVHTSRLYNGDHLSCIPESAGVLLATSSVLRQDSRHHNSVSALSTAIESTHAPEIRRTDRPDLRTALETLEDVLLILMDPHFVVDALVDARDIVEGVLKSDMSTFVDKELQKIELEAASKKLYFFIVWANDTLVRSDAVGATRRFDSEFDRIAASVESGAAICSMLRDDTLKYLESQVEMMTHRKK